MTVLPRVFAIRYARSVAPKASYFYGSDPHEGDVPMDFFIWLIRVGSRTILVDAGFSEQTARRRSKELTADPLGVLSSLGASADLIDGVILTHLHYDHCGLISSFPNAQVWVQEKEMSFWTGRFASRRPLVAAIEPTDIATMVGLNFEGRLHFVDGDAEIVPGVSVHWVGGHSAGLQVVRVATDGGPTVLASDASHLYEQFELDRPSSVVQSLPEMLAAFDRLRELAGADGDIVPGHDPLVLSRYRPVPGLEGVAVELGPTLHSVPRPDS
jgi:glyoxylase-like metal-dependent hydrolase (beta-lactamase superfamily II)